MTGPTGDGTSGGADAKRDAEALEPQAGSQASPGPTLFQASAAPTPGGRRWLLVGAVALIGGGALFAARALVKGAPPSASPAKPVVAPPTPVAVPEGETVKVPGGTFSMGSDDGDPDEKPITQVSVAAFELDATEVTIAAYRKCVAAGKCTEPDTGMYCNWRKAGARGPPRQLRRSRASDGVLRVRRPPAPDRGGVGVRRARHGRAQVPMGLGPPGGAALLERRGERPGQR